MHHDAMKKWEILFSTSDAELWRKLQRLPCFSSNIGRYLFLNQVRKGDEECSGYAFQEGMACCRAVH